MAQLSSNARLFKTVSDTVTTDVRIPSKESIECELKPRKIEARAQNDAPCCPTALASLSVIIGEKRRPDPTTFSK